MSMRVNLNTAAMNASRNLAANDTRMGKSIERLSSGYRINSAADDPAGLVNSENLRAQIGGLGQAISNSQDAVNMVKTAEGALTEVHSLLQSMRNLAVHAANAGANSNEAVSADQAQIKSAVESLNRISSTTAFGSKKLLDGSAGFTSNITGAAVSSMSMGGSGSVFQGINGASVSVNVTQAATKTSSAGAAFAADVSEAAGNVQINGVDIGTFAAGTDNSAIEAAINAKTAETGVKATYDSGAHTFTLEQTKSGSANGIELGGQAAAVLGGTTGVMTTTGGKDAVASVTIGGTSTTTFSAGSGETLKNAAGDTIVLSDATAGNKGVQGTVTNSALSFQIGANAGETATVSLGNTKASNLGTGNGTTTNSVADIDVTSASGAQDAIKVLDSAITQVSKQRADLGAFQKNVLESNINSLGVAKENVAASESSIRDTDMAAEMVQFTRFQILNQAGTSMLTQANQAPQQLLSLLR